MTKKEFREECSSGKWLPILVMRTEEKIIVPIFDTALMAGQFVKRNLPQNWLCGVVDLQVKDAQLMDDRGWEAIKFTFPRKLKDVVDFDVEILEFELNHKLRIDI
jgi:hypothetical protein